jgi:hypothetical protein
MNISTLETYVNQKNKWGAIFGQKPLSLLNADDRQKIAEELDCELSPENLSCDGEISAAKIRKKFNYLHQCVAELRSIDPNVVMYEA